MGSSGRSAEIKALTSVGIDRKRTCATLEMPAAQESRVPQVVERRRSDTCFANSTRQTRGDRTFAQTAGRTILGPEKWPGMVEDAGQVAFTLDAAVMPTFHLAYFVPSLVARAAFEEDFRAVCRATWTGRCRHESIGQAGNKTQSRSTNVAPKTGCNCREAPKSRRTRAPQHIEITAPARARRRIRAGCYCSRMCLERGCQTRLDRG